jgi:N-acetylneuraminic acid mutarotase
MKLAIIAAAATLIATSTGSAQSWTQMADMPDVGRHHPVTFSIDGFGYVATGSRTTSSTSNDFYRYDPVANTWTTLPNFPGTSRGYSYGGAYNGKGYLGFGRTASAGYLSDLWEYDPVTEMWTQLASCPGQPRSHPTFVITDDGMLYVGCGSSSIGNLGDWWEYDIANDTWVQRDDLPGPNRHHPYYFNVGDVPYMGFGHGAGIYKDFYRFDPVTHEWTRMNDFPGEARVAGTQFTYDGAGYVLSGEGVDHAQFETGELWKYDSDADSWSEMAPHPGSARWAPGTFLIGSTLYFTAGLSTTRLEKDMWSADLDDIVGTETPSVSAPELVLRAPRPNPFSTETILRFELDTAGATSVNIYDALGRLVSTQSVSNRPAGTHAVTWDGRSNAGGLVAPGVYYVRLSTATRQTVRSVTVLR